MTEQHDTCDSQDRARGEGQALQWLRDTEPYAPAQEHFTGAALWHADLGYAVPFAVRLHSDPGTWRPAIKAHGDKRILDVECRTPEVAVGRARAFLYACGRGIVARPRPWWER